MTPVGAALLAGGAVLAAALVARRYGPSPGHPAETAWYATLRKPSYTPPGAVIGAAWALLDTLLAVAGYRLLTAPPNRDQRRALAFWSTVVAGIPAYTRVFFGDRRIAGGLGVIVGMLVSAVAATVSALKVDRVAAISIAPLVGWLSFAGLLNEEVWRGN